MSSTMYTIGLVLSMLVVDVWYYQTTAGFTCDQLPKLEMDSIEVLVSNGPFVSDFTFTSLHECCVRLFTHPARGTTDYHGTFIQIKGSEVNTYDYYFDSEKKTIKVTTCGTGEEFSGHVLAAQFGQNGSFICTYHCDNTILKGFSCSSNNDGASPAEIEAVKLARKVSNGHLIYDARKNCPSRKGCKLFY